MATNKRIRCVFGFLGCICLSAWCEGQITPQPADCTIDVSGKSVKPARVASPWQPECLVSGVRVSIRNELATGHDAASGKELWSLNGRTNHALFNLAAGEDTVYLAEYPDVTDRNSPKYQKPAQVMPLHVPSGKWLPPLVVGAEAPMGQDESVVRALVMGDRLIALSVVFTNAPRTEENGKAISYKLSCFLRGVAKPQWTQTFACNVAGRPFGAMLWMGNRWGVPGVPEPALPVLTRMEDKVLVCASELQDIVCVDPATGKSDWQLSRIWEYRRGFIGPSVWSHFIERFGVERFDLKESNIETLRQEFNKRFQCRIIDGPIVVPYAPARGGKPASHMFVAVSVGPGGQWSETLADCVVYEVNEQGKPQGMVTLPTMIVPGSAHVVSNGMAWACEGSTFVKLVTSEGGHIMMGGVGDTGALCTLDWLRRLRPDAPHGWLTSAPAGKCIAVSGSHAFMTCVGGFVKAKDDHTYRFPITVLDLENGRIDALELDVPFKGDLPEPKENCITAGGNFETYGPYLMGVCAMTVDNDELHVCLGMQNWTSRLSYRLKDLIPGKAK